MNVREGGKGIFCGFFNQHPDKNQELVFFFFLTVEFPDVTCGSRQVLMMGIEITGWKRYEE